MTDNDNVGEALPNDDKELQTITSADVGSAEEVLGEVLTNGADHSQDVAPVEDNGAILDINDPRLNESYEGDGEANLNEFFLPKDGVYPCTLSFIEGKTAYAKPRTNGQIMIIAPLNATIEWTEEKPGGAQVNRSMDIREYVNDMIFEGNATSELGDVLRLTGYPHAARITKKALLEHTQAVIDGHPQCQIKVRREGYCKTCDEQFLADEQKKADLGEGSKEYKKARVAASEKAYLKGERAGGWKQDEWERTLSSVECHECGNEIQGRMKKLAFLPMPRTQ